MIRKELMVDSDSRDCPFDEKFCDDEVRNYCNLCIIITQFEKSVRADERRKFADKIKLHMIKYCHGRLEQQYCAAEVIDYIGKLMGEKDYSIDVETEIKKHDKKVREEAIDELLTWIKHEEAEGKIHSLDDYDRIAEYLKEAGAKWQD